MEALRTALTELKVNAVIVRNATPRAFYKDQQGMGLADYIIELKDCPYDIGLYKAATGKGYVCRADLFQGRVAAIFGAVAKKGESHEQASMGKLFQMYAVHAATRKAIQQGMTVRRVNIADGGIRLVVNGIQ